MMGPVGGSGGWLSEKNQIFFVLNAKKPKKTTCLFLFLSIFGGWVGVSDPNMDISIFFLFFLTLP